MLAAVVPLVALHATLIAVKGTDGQCPSSRQISAAIEARLPGLLVPPEQSWLADALLLTLSADPSTGAQSFTLVDHQEQTRLRRELPPPTRADAEECPALADTVALMVERYLQELGYRAEPPHSTDRRRWDLFAGAAWRPGADGLSAYELRLGGGRALGARGRLALGLVAGIEGASQQEWPGASGRLRRYPAEVRLLWRASTAPIALEAGPFAGAQLLILDSRAGDAAVTDAHLIPVVGLLGGLRIPLGRLAFLRVVGSLGVALLRSEFVTADASRRVAFGTERLWGKMGLEAGFSFW
jgi:hypothetical protein